MRSQKEHFLTESALIAGNLTAHGPIDRSSSTTFISADRKKKIRCPTERSRSGEHRFPLDRKNWRAPSGPVEDGSHRRCARSSDRDDSGVKPGNFHHSCHQKLDFGRS